MVIGGSTMTMKLTSLPFGSKFFSRTHIAQDHHYSRISTWHNRKADIDVEYDCPYSN